MCKQIKLFFIFLSFTLLHCQSATPKINSPVFQNSKVIGYVNTETNLSCDSCYALKSIIIGGDKVVFKIPVSSNSLGGKNIFQEDCQLNVLPAEKVWLINYNNIYNSENYIFQLQKSGKIFTIAKTTKIVSTVKNIEISVNDFADFRATAICESTNQFNLSLKNPIELEHYFIRSEDQCFYCPSKYSVEECFEKKKSNFKFNWE